MIEDEADNKEMTFTGSILSFEDEEGEQESSKSCISEMINTTIVSSKDKDNSTSPLKSLKDELSEISRIKLLEEHGQRRLYHKSNVLSKDIVLL